MAETLLRATRQDNGRWRADFDDNRNPESEQIRRAIEALARWMDAAFEVPGLGWRFGFDALIGLVPGLGDAATTLVSVYLLALASRCGVPRITLARMSLNVAIDMIGGALPLVGDLFDVWWKANLKNAALLSERLEASPREARKARTSDWLFVGLMFGVLAVVFVGAVAVTAMIVAAAWHLVAAGFGH